MMKGRLGKPVGGWPRKVQKVVLGKQKPLKGRPGADLKPLNLERTRKKVEEEISRKVNDDDLLSYLMYPEVSRTTTSSAANTVMCPCCPVLLTFTGCSSARKSP